MTSIVRSAKANSKYKIIFITNQKELDKLGLESSQKSWAKKHLKDDFSYVEINNYSKGKMYLVKTPSKSNDLLNEKARKCGAKVTAVINGDKADEVSLEGESLFSIAFVEGMALTNYQFLKYFSDADKRKNSLKKIHLDAKYVSEEQLNEINAVIEATCWARDMVNEPVSFLNAPELGNQIKKIGKKAGFKVEVLDHLKIQTLKMGGLLAVNQGSVDGATFSILEWKPKNAKNKKPIVLVGKGVVYDTGGLSLKPTPNSMDIMKCDMGGAAAVAGAVYAAAKADLPVHVVALVPATDNRPGGNAYAPGDVITMFDGTKVEVLNTDAEGRMILADALSYAKKYKPELVMDAATLTGSAMRAIGTYGTVVMGTAKDSVFNKLEKSGNETYERTVRFPFWEEYADELKSEIADLTNLGGANAGAITAGKFLEHFTDYPWIHLDIAAPAWQNAESGYLKKGGTGVGVRLFFNFLKNY